ncbi:MAG: hypothetical protein MJ179_10240 [Treponema sp.]|nr:hypothetical protein [Treponema sp.]
MGIKKDIQNDYHVNFNYHRIAEVAIFKNDRDIQLHIITESYVSKEARLAGAKAVKVENVIQHADFALSPFYALLKAKFPMFQNGTDDLDDEIEEAQETKPDTCYTQQSPQGDLIAHWSENDLIEKANKTNDKEEE